MIKAVCLHGYSAGSIVKVVLHPKLAATVLAVALLGANTAMASVCEAYCAGVGKKNSDHHHQTAATPSSSHHHMHAQTTSGGLSGMPQDRRAVLAAAPGLRKLCSGSGAAGKFAS